MLSRALFVAVCVCLPAVALAANWTAASYGQTIMMNVAMVNEKVGFIGGAQNGEGSNVLKTEDGGATWNQQNMAANTFMVMTSAAASETSAVIGGVSILSGSAQWTHDGVNFVNSSEPRVLVEEAMWQSVIQGVPGGFATVGGFQILNDSNLINGVSVSVDGGASWTVKDTGSQVPTRYGAFPSANTWFLTLGTFPNTSKALGYSVSRHVHVHADTETNEFKMHFVPEHETADDNGWIGQIMRTNDGGNTWDLLLTNQSLYFNQIACPSVSVCFAAGENDDYSVVYRTTDGGASWEEVLATQGSSKMSAFALSEQEAWIGGGVLAFPVVGHAFHTTDGGNTWTLDLIADNYLNAMSFPDAAHGWATTITTEQQSGILIYA